MNDLVWLIRVIWRQLPWRLRTTLTVVLLYLIFLNLSLIISSARPAFWPVTYVVFGWLALDQIIAFIKKDPVPPPIRESLRRNREMKHRAEAGEDIRALLPPAVQEEFQMRAARRHLDDTNR